MAVSEAQKRAQKKYNEKNKKLEVVYTKDHLQEYTQFKEYCQEHGVAVNSMLMKLVREFLSDPDKGSSRPSVPDLDLTKIDQPTIKLSLFPCSEFSEEDLSLLRKHFSEESLKQIWDKLYSDMLHSYEFEEILNEAMQNWMDDLKEKVAVLEESGNPIDEQELLKDVLRIWFF